MQKTQIKPKKDKKKNTQTGLLMGQNINIFSQLSATYLTNKTNVTEQEQHFVKQTQIIQYHDQNINRLISLLRKKAEVTKNKAVLQLKQEILKMDQNQINQFIATYANLYQQIVLNQQSKQVYEQFVEITCFILQKFKKIALKQIQTLYPSMLISIKFNRLAKLLFTGNQEEMNQKGYILFLKKQVRKKFIIISKILLQNEQTHLIIQTNYQRNVSQYTRAIKDLLNIYLNHSKKQQLAEDTFSLLEEISDLIFGKPIDQYFKAGGKGKASLIQLYTVLINISSIQKFQLPWKKMAKIVCQNFLDKDPMVQQNLWKYCNKQTLLSFKRFSKSQQKDDYTKILQQFLPKFDQKLFDCLSIGGIFMYKNLPGYVLQFPTFQFNQTDNHKSIIQKLNFIRKFIQQILLQQDQNQSRIQCYFNISVYILQKLILIENQYLSIIIQKQNQKIGESKKQKQIKSLIKNVRLETVINLQKKYYSQPPVSRNSFSYYIPEYFSKLIKKFQIEIVPTFNQKLTFALYKDVNKDSQILQKIFQKCQNKLDLLSNFYQNWPSTDKQVNLDMTQNNQEYEKTAKIYLLANRKRAYLQNYWFAQDWDLRKSLIVFDPRLTAKDLENQMQDNSNFINFDFSPLTKNISPIYDISELNSIRFKFFIKIIQSSQIQSSNIKFFLPYLFSHLLNQQNINLLLEKYYKKAQALKNSKWIVGQKQVTQLRILVQCFSKYLIKIENNNNIQKISLKFKLFFSTIGNFLIVLNSYKMDKEVEEILKNLNSLIRNSNFQNQIFFTVQKILQDVFSQINKSVTAINQQKLKKNRLKRLNDFIEKVVWYLVKRNSKKQQNLILELFKQSNLWKDAQIKVQPWAIGYTIFQNCNQQINESIANSLVQKFEDYIKIISLLLSCQLVLPLQVYPQFKRIYVHFQNSLNKRFSNLQIYSQLDYLQYLVIYQYQNNLLTESLGLKNLIKNCLKYYHTFKNDQLLQLKNRIVDKLINKFILEDNTNSQALSLKAMILNNVLSEIPLQELPQINQTYQKILLLLQENIKMSQSQFNQFLALSLLSSLFWRYHLSEKSLQIWQQNKLIGALINRLIPQIKQIQSPSTYHSFVIFSVINSLYSTFRMELIEKNFQSIIKIFWHKQQNQRQNQMYIFKQEQRVRFINRIFLQLKQQKIESIIIELPKQALNEYSHFEKALLQIQQQQEQQTHSSQKSIQNLFIQYSQLFMKMTTYLSMGQPKTIPNETTIIKLLQCPYAGVKKTCFILLKQLYDLKLVKSEIPVIYKQILTYKLKNNDDIQDIKVIHQIYNFLYNWLALISRRKVTQVSKDQQQVSYSLQQFIQNDSISQMFLNNLFILLADKIDYLKNQNQFSLTSQQLLMNDFSMNVQEESNVIQKLYFLSAKLILSYSINFPLYLRTFMDKSKKYRSTCEKIVRNLISDAIFSQQVSMIQIREPQWKADGNLQIYVTKKSKQIYAQYQHDVIRIGLRLVMRPNYPLTPIHIQFGQGLKMEDGSKWALMLQSQLHNKNNSIINGILLWKDNINKKLSGVQECAICYDIVNPNGHLPKKACKTCKKKFHSNCIMKWFSKSNKSQCPLCKSQFL